MPPPTNLFANLDEPDDDDGDGELPRPATRKQKRRRSLELCPDCDHKVSVSASECPKCGCKFSGSYGGGSDALGVAAGVVSLLLVAGSALVFVASLSAPMLFFSSYFIPGVVLAVGAIGLAIVSLSAKGGKTVGVLGAVGGAIGMIAWVALALMVENQMSQIWRG